jgi:N-acyl-D-amino-acid deacylase
MSEGVNMYDILIKNGRLIDGTGNPWRHAHVAVSDGRVAAIMPYVPGLSETLPEAEQVIDAEGMVITPGFIDVHNHADLSVLDDPYSPYFVFQGLTTVIVGNCGHSVVGGGADMVRDYFHRQGLLSARQLKDTRQWNTLDEYRELVKNQGGLALNSGVLMGHGSIRYAVIGHANRPASGEEIEKMKALVQQGMEQGAVGLSTGLDYRPGKYAGTGEIVELAKVAASYGGIYATHVRNNPDYKDAVAAIEEAITIGEQAGARVQISHISKNSLLGREMEIIEKARDRGVDVAADAIPYSTGFAVKAVHTLMGIRSGVQDLFHLSLDEVKEVIRDKEQREALKKEARLFKRLKPRSTLLIHCEDASMEGKTLAEVARQRGVSAADCLIDMVLEGKEFTTCPRYEFADDVAAIPDVQVKHPAIFMGTDAGPVDPHDLTGWFSPQGSGSTLRYLLQCSRYDVPLEEAIRKLTSLGYQRFGIWDRGLVATGQIADILVFDPKKLEEVTDWDYPYAAPKGMQHVIVSGVPIVINGVQQKNTPAGIL